MADSTQEKTEQATGKRRDEARREGQVAYSRELTGGVLFLVGLGSLKMTGDEVFASLFGLIRVMFALPLEALDESAPAGFLSALMETFVWRLLPIFGLAFAAALAPGIVQTGFQLSPAKLQLKGERLNPLKGIKRLFSLDSLVTVGMSILKMSLVGVVLWISIADAIPRVAALGDRSLGDIVKLMLELLFLLGFRVAAGLLVLGIADLFYRRWKHNKDLMMTKEEVKEERKNAEGDPRMKGRIREVQRQVALQRMKTDVRGADVVVRNPTHYAVALKYDRERDASPRVVAKGRALMALTIIRIAEEAGVEVIENRPLARDLYRSVEVGQSVPERLFKAVAEVLAFVYRKRGESVAR